MQRVILSAFLIICSYCTCAQSFIDSLESAIRAHPLVSTITTRLDGLKKTNWVAVGTMDFDFGAKTLAGEFTSDESYYLNAHSRNDTIFALEIVKWEKDKDVFTKRSVFQYFDTAMAKEYIETHNHYYFSKSVIADFFSPRFGHYGFACGYSGRTPASMLVLLKMIEEKNIDSLTVLAGSLYPEDRAYAVTGLYFLMRKGIELTAVQQKLIELNQSSAVEAFSCTGCTYGVTPLKDLLNRESLDGHYKWYEERKQY